jgi:hypothetical protein
MTLLQMLISAGRRSWRGSDQSASARSSRALSITCRGKSISREELFAYTNGRFLVNEAAAVGGPLSPIEAIEKLEGGFSKALLMRKEDGQEIIVKIPFPIAGPPKYTTASEVAILHYRKRIIATYLYGDYLYHH